MVGLGLRKILVPHIYKDLRDPVKTTWIEMNTFQVQFLMSFFKDRMWTILSKNTNKYAHAKLRQAKGNGDKDPIELLIEGVYQNPCAQLNN